MNSYARLMRIQKGKRTKQGEPAEGGGEEDPDRFKGMKKKKKKKKTGFVSAED